MTNNPLAARNAALRETPQIPRNGASYAHDLAAYYNSLRTRGEVEWFVDSSGLVRIGTPSGYTVAHTRNLDRKAEHERQRWLENHRNPQPWGAYQSDYTGNR